LASCIPWRPSGVGAVPDPVYAIFITQHALAAVQAHIGTPGSTGAGGFLAGELLSCPESGRAYVVIESAIRAPFPVVHDDTKRLLARGWEVAQSGVRTGREHVVGWYHSHPGIETTLSPGDADAHLTFFDRPWHVALVVATGGEAAGGFFCRSGSSEWHSERLPFYELSAEGPFAPSAPRPSIVSWANYRTEAEVVPASDIAARAAALPRLLLYPDEFAPDPPRIPHAARYRRYGLFALLSAAALFGLYLARGSAAAPAPRPPDVARAPVVSTNQLDRLADSVVLATTAYDLRANLFASRRMGCPDLARGLVEMEERWMAYSLARRDAPGVLDAPRSARDKALDAQVDAVERRFERSPCPRP